MKLTKISVMLLAISLSTVGCSLKVPDVEVCTEISRGRAFCATTLSDQERVLSKSRWDRRRVGMLCMDSDDFGKRQAFLEEACERQGCTQGDKKKIEQFFRKFERLNGT